ncbi:MAG: hypothetical protein ACRCWU_02540 [Metamycoplasmataceae bacterium]
MKTQTTVKSARTITSKPTRQYTCSRRRNKENKKIWVVLENGRKFYRIFKNRTLAISYFKKLKTIYAEMLVQDLYDNVFSSIVFTKLETKKRGLVEALQNYDGGIVENSDELFDEDAYLADFNPNKEDVESHNNRNRFIEKELDLSFVDNLFPKQKPLLSPYKVKIHPNNNKPNKGKLISDRYQIKIYQNDLDLVKFVLDKFAYEEHKKLGVIDQNLDLKK